MSSRNEKAARAGASKRRPGGRTADVSKRIEEATLGLLVEGGFDAVTFQEVAKRADVGRATLYRRWESPAALVQDAVLQFVEAEVVAGDAGSLRADLDALLRQIATFLSGPIGKAAMIASLVAPRGEDDKTIEASVWPSRSAAIEPIFERAKQRGELAAETDFEALFANVAGALYFRIIVMGAAIDDECIGRVLDAALVSARR